MLTGPGGRVLAVFYVDDAIIAAKTAAQADAIVALIGSMFEIRSLGEPRDFLGINITRDRAAGTISIDQTDKVDKLVTQFGLGGESCILPLVSRALILPPRCNNASCLWTTTAASGG